MVGALFKAALGSKSSEVVREWGNRLARIDEGIRKMSEENLATATKTHEMDTLVLLKETQAYMTAKVFGIYS